MTTQAEYSIQWQTLENLKLKKHRKDLFRKYVWKEEEDIGGGAQARVIRMVCASDHRLQCAMKVIPFVNDQDVDQIKKECKILTMVEHPNILQHYDYKIDLENQRVYIYTELLMRVSRF